MLKNTGVISDEELKIALPPDERLNKGPVAIFECLQDIPCDPCVSSCKFKAISMADGITSRPVLNFDKCTGCGACIPRCPGLAIFVVNKKFSELTSSLSLSYEMYPLPEKGDKLMALNRAGEDVKIVDVIRVLSPDAYDKTAVVTIEIPSDKIMEIRGIRFLREDEK